MIDSELMWPIFDCADATVAIITPAATNAHQRFILVPFA
jgi:hypothetical protein